MYEYHEIVIEMIIEQRFEQTLHAISFFFDWMQSNLYNWIIQYVFVTTIKFLHRWISLIERYKYQITYINHLRFHLLMIVELKHKQKSNLNIKVWCMQSNFRNWITFLRICHTNFIFAWLNFAYRELHISCLIYLIDIVNFLFMNLFNDRLWVSLLHIWVYWAKAKVLTFSSICMQSTLRSWISQCAFVTRTWFWHRWISLVERYRYLVLDDNLLLWISRISIFLKFHLWVLCTKVKTLIFSYKFCISALIYERILNRFLARSDFILLILTRSSSSLSISMTSN